MTRKALESARRRLLSRRRALQGGSALLTTAAVACGDDGVTAGDGGASSSGTTSSAIDESSDAVADSTGSTSGGSTDDGTTGLGSTDDDTTADESTGEPVDPPPDGPLGNIDHIIVLCMENRSFDHYFGALQLVEGHKDVDGLNGTETNPDQNGVPIGVFEMDNFEPEDPPHGWDACHAQWNGGANDGFVTEHFNTVGDELKHEVMGYHVREHIPVLYALADAYTLCDAWFASVLTQTWPNRYYLHCVDGAGRTDNVPAFPAPVSIQTLCDEHGISNNNYYDGLAAWKWGAYPITGFAGTAGIGELFDKLANGGLEQVVIIDPDFLSNDDHPPRNIQLGQALIASIYQALAQSQYWERSLLIITYDEHGGFYDHAPPPTTIDDNGPEFQQMGFRVPTVVIGPHVRSGAVNHTVFEHGSFCATVAERFGLPPLNARMAATADLSSCIDPDFVEDPQPPIRLPALMIKESDALAGLGDVTSQPELFEAIGIPVPLRGADRERHRQGVLRLLAEAELLGVATIVRDLSDTPQ